MDSTTLIIIGAVVVAVIILIVGIVNVRSEKDLLEERLGRMEESYEQFLDEPEEEPVKKGKSDETGFVKVGFIQRLDEAMADRQFGKKWRVALARADLKITVAEYMAVHVIAVVVFSVLAFLILFPQNIVMAVVAEFIDSSETLSWLTKHSCDFGEGWFLGRARPIEELQPAPH